MEVERIVDQLWEKYARIIQEQYWDLESDVKNVDKLQDTGKLWDMICQARVWLKTGGGGPGGEGGGARQGAKISKTGAQI